MGQVILGADTVSDGMRHAEAGTVKGDPRHARRDLHAGFAVEVVPVFVAGQQALEYQFAGLGRIAAREGINRVMTDPTPAKEKNMELQRGRPNVAPTIDREPRSWSSDSVPLT